MSVYIPFCFFSLTSSLSDPVLCGESERGRERESERWKGISIVPLFVYTGQGEADNDAYTIFYTVVHNIKYSNT